MKLTHTTPGGVTFTITELSDGGLQVAAESATYGPHNAFVRLNSDGSNPTVTVQQGAGAHILVVEAGGTGSTLYNSEAS